MCVCVFLRVCVFDVCACVHVRVLVRVRVCVRVRVILADIPHLARTVWRRQRAYSLP